MRGRVLALTVAVCLIGGWAAVGTASASAKLQPLWETIYSGEYAFTGNTTSLDPFSGGANDSHTTSAKVVYSFVVDRRDRFTNLGHDRFREQVSVNDLSFGTTTFQQATTLPGEDPTVSSDVACFDGGPAATFIRTRTGIASPAPGGHPERLGASGGPGIAVGWSVPAEVDSTGQYYFDGTPFDESRSGVLNDAPGVRQHCVDHTLNSSYDSQDGRSLLDSNVETTDGGQAGTYAWDQYDQNAAHQWSNKAFPSCGGQYLTPPSDYDEWWDGSATTHFGALPYRKAFTFSKSISGAEAAPTPIDSEAVSASCSFNVSYSGNVAFDLVTCEGYRPSLTADTPTPPPGTSTQAPANHAFNVKSSGQACQKVGNLLAHEGITVMSGSTAGMSTGQGTEVLFPGIPEGGLHATPAESVDVEVVSGQVVSKHSRAARTAAAPAVLYRATGTAKPGAPTLLKLNPTPGGAQLLGKSHGDVPATVTITLTPKKGHGKPTTASGRLTIPATG